MKKPRASTGSNDSAPKRGAKKQSSPKDPFAVPPHPLGYNFLEERPRLRASRFDTILPSVVAKYGLGRRLIADQYHEAWREALEALYGGQEEFDFVEESASNRLETFLKCSRPTSLRGGVLRIEVVSHLLASELQFQTPRLLDELRARLPNETINEIKLAVR